MAFKIPLQSEVVTYMKEKKGWPIEFCRYYAERFWNFYNSNGWKVSGKAAMKSWQSAFTANWQNLKYDEDIKELAKWQRSTQAKHLGLPQANAFQRLDLLMQQCIRDTESISSEKYCAVHDWLNERGWIHIEPDQEQIVKDLCKEEDRAKVMRVKFLFNNMSAKGKSFLMYAKQQANI